MQITTKKSPFFSACAAPSPAEHFIETFSGEGRLKKRTESTALNGPGACWGLAARVHSPLACGDALVDGETVGVKEGLAVAFGKIEGDTARDGEGLS